MHSHLKSANTKSKTVYNIVSEFAADKEVIDEPYSFDGVEYDLSKDYSYELGAVLTNGMDYFDVSEFVKRWQKERQQFKGTYRLSAFHYCLKFFEECDIMNIYIY